MENVQRLPPLDRNANTGRADHITYCCCRQPGRAPSSTPPGNQRNRDVLFADNAAGWRMTRYDGRDHTTCLVLLQDIFRSRPFNLALLRSRMARFVEVNMGITPRNVRSEGVTPCK
jgi:hypothetical protein